MTPNFSYSINSTFDFLLPSVAVQCLSEAYGVNLSDKSQKDKYEVKLSLEVSMHVDPNWV